MKFFCSLKKLLIYYENNKICFENYFNNRRGIIADNATNNFCIDEEFSSLIYTGSDGNLYDVPITATGTNEKICVLQKKCGNSEILPVNVFKRNNEKYYIYMLKNPNEEHLLAVQKGISIPQTVGSFEVEIFGIGTSNDVLSFAFKNENKIVIKNYNFNSDDFQAPYIINTDFKEISKINCLYKNNKILVLVSGINQEDIFEIVSFDEKGSSSVFKDNDLNLPEKIYFTTDTMILEHKDYYFNLIKERPKETYELLSINCCEKIIYILVPNNEKIKHIFEKINSIEMIYNKHIKRIEALKNEIVFSEKQIDNVLEELNKLC